MPLENSVSSASSESDEFDLKHLIQSRHLRRVLINKNPSKSENAGRGQQEDGADVASSSDSSSVNFPETRSDWTRRRSRRNVRGERQGGRMSWASRNENEYDENDGRNSFPTGRGPYHALQLATDRLTGGLQDDIAHQLESVEEQLEAVGLQMKEVIAAGLRDGSFKSRLGSSGADATEPRPFSTNNQQPPADRRTGSSSIPKQRDRGSQTSPTGMRYSTHTSTDPLIDDDKEYKTESQQPVKQHTQGGGRREPSRQSECKDTQKDDIAATSSSAGQLAVDKSGYEYNILKLEGMNPDSNGSTSTISIVSEDSSRSDKSQQKNAEARVYQARGCQTCRCHSCRVPSDPVQTIQILGVVDNAQSESSAPVSREFMTMDIKTGRIPQGLGLIQICRDYEALEGEYEHTWKQASVLQQSNEVTFPPMKDEQPSVQLNRSSKQLEPGGTSKSDHLIEAGQSSKNSLKDPDTEKWHNAILKSKLLREKYSSFNARGGPELGSVDDEAKYPAGQPSHAVHHPDRDMDSELRCYCADDAGRNIRSEIFSLVDKELEYSTSHSTDNSSELEGVLGEGMTTQDYSNLLERNFSQGPESSSALEMQRNLRKRSQQTEAPNVKIPYLEPVKFQEEHILNGPRSSQSKERWRSKTHLSPESIHEYGTISWSHQKQQTPELDSTTLDQDENSNSSGEERKVIEMPNQEFSFSGDANKGMEVHTGPRSGAKAPLRPSRSSDKFPPTLGSVSSPRLPSEASERPSLEVPLQKPRPDTRPRSSEKYRDKETDGVPNRHVAQSRVYIDIRQEYKPGDHVSHQGMHSRMQDEIAKEFALLGISRRSSSSKKSIRSKSASKLPGPRNDSHEYHNNALRPEVSKLEEGSSGLHNLYEEDSDLRSRAGQMFSPEQEYGIPAHVYGIPPERSSNGQIGHAGAAGPAQSFQESQTNLGPRASVTQRLAAVGRSSKRRSKSAQRPRFDQDVERPAADGNTFATYRRPTPYPLSLTAEARLRKEEILRQLENTKNLGVFAAQQPVDWTQEPDQPHWATASGEISATKASVSGDSKGGPDSRRRGDALVQILNKKSSRSANRRKTRETSVQYNVTNRPRDRSSLVQPMSELLDSNSRQNSIDQMEMNSDPIPGHRGMEALESSISRPRTMSEIPRRSGGSRIPASQEEKLPDRHPTVIGQNWNEPSNSDGVEDYEERPGQKLTKRNLKTLASKSSQKYLAKMLTRLAQKLAVLQSRGLIESQTPQQLKGWDSERLPLPESVESGGQDWSSEPSTSGQRNAESELGQQFDHLHLRKSQDLTNLMRRRNSQWPFQQDLSINTKETFPPGSVDDEYSDPTNIPQTSDTSPKWSHQASRASMLANNLEILSAEMASKKNQMPEEQQLREEWHPGTPHSLSLRDSSEEIPSAIRKNEPRERSEENMLRADSRSTDQRDFQSQMPPSSEDIAIRSSFRHQIPITEHWESRNHQSIQTQTVEGMSSQDERQARDGEVPVLSRPPIHYGNSTSSSEALQGLHFSPNGHEPPWDRSLEKWHPRASKGGGRLTPQADDELRANKQFQARSRSESSAQTEEFGPIRGPPFDPQIGEHSRSQRMDSMETQPGELEFRGRQYLQHPIPQHSPGDPFGFHGHQESRFRQATEAGSRQHPISAPQSIRGIHLVSEEKESGNQVPPNQVQQPSDLEDMVSTSRQQSNVQRMVDSMGAQHETRGGMGEMNFRSQPYSHTPMSRESQVQRMHSVAVQPESRKLPSYEPVDTFARRNHQNSGDDKIHTFISVQPEAMQFGFDHHSQSGRMLHSHAVQPEDMDSLFPHHSHSGRKYSDAVQQPEGMTLAMHDPQSAETHSSRIQPEGLESRNPHPPQIRGDYGYNSKVQPEGLESRNPHPAQLRGEYGYNSGVQPEGLETRNIHAPQIRGDPHPAQIRGEYGYTSRVQPEGLETRNLHAPQIRGDPHPAHIRGEYGYTSRVQPEGLETRNLHAPQIRVEYGFAEHSETNESQISHPSQRGNFVLQPKGMEAGLRHQNQSGRIHSSPHHAQQSEVMGSLSSHHSQRGRMPYLPVHPIDLEIESHHQSRIDPMHSFPGRPGDMESRSRLPSEALDARSRRPSDMERMQRFAGIHQALNVGRPLPSDMEGVHSFALIPEALNDLERMNNFRVIPEVLNAGSRRPSDMGREQSFEMIPETLSAGGLRPPDMERMDSLGVIPEPLNVGSRRPSDMERMHSFAVQPGGLDAGSHRPSDMERMNSFAVIPQALDGGRGRPSDMGRMHTFGLQPEDMDSRSRRPFEHDRMHGSVLHPEATSSHGRHPSQQERMYSPGVQARSTVSGSKHSSEIQRMHSFAVQPEVSGNLETSQKRVPEIRTSHHSLVGMTDNSSKDFEALQTDRGGAERKTSSAGHPLNDLPPDVLSLGSKNPRKSSQIQMLNDMLQDLEATVSKSRQNSQARMKNHVLTPEFDAVAGRKSKRLSKTIKFKAPGDEQTNLGTVTLPDVEGNFERYGEKSAHSDTEISEYHDETPATPHKENFYSEQLESHSNQLDAETPPPFEQESLVSQPKFEDEMSGSYLFEGELLEGEQTGIPQDTPDILPWEHPVEEQQDEQTDLEGTSHPVEGSGHHDDRHDFLSSRKSHGFTRGSNHSSDETTRSSLKSHMKDGPRTSSSGNQRGSQLQDSQRHPQTKSGHRAARLKSNTKDELRKSSLKSHTKDELRKSSLKSHTKDELRTSSLKSHTKDELRTSSLKSQTKNEPRKSTFKSQRGFQLQGSQSRTQSQMNDMPQHSGETAPGRLRTSDLMPEELETSGASENAYPAEELTSLETEIEGEDLVPFETEIEGEELVPSETEGEDLVPFETEIEGEELVPFETEGEEFIPSETEDEELTPLETEGEQLLPYETEGEELLPNETEGEQLLPYETEREEIVSLDPRDEEFTPLENEGAEPTSVETQGEELTSLETQDDRDFRKPLAEAPRTAERRVTSRVVGDKEGRLKAKTKRLDSIVKEFINEGSSSHQNPKYK